jgi:hypothetical protein
MKKRILFLLLIAAGLASAPRVMAQGYTDALLTSINYNTTYPCGNSAGTTTENIRQALAAAAHFGGGVVDLTCYQGDIEIDADIFSTITTPILLYLPLHDVTVNADATIPVNFEICGGPGAGIDAGGGFTLTNNAENCFTGWTGGGGGTPGAPPLSIQAASADGLTFIGIPGTTIDPVLGNITIQGGFQVIANPSGFGVSIIDSGGSGQFFAKNGPTGILEIDSSNAEGILIDSTGEDIGGGGTGPTLIHSAGGFSAQDNSASGPMGMAETGAATTYLESNGTGGFVIDATGSSHFDGSGTGPINLVTAQQISLASFGDVGDAIALSATGAGNIELVTSGTGQIFLNSFNNDITIQTLNAGHNINISSANAFLVQSTEGTSINDSSTGTPDNGIALIEHGTADSFGILLQDLGGSGIRIDEVSNGTMTFISEGYGTINIAQTGTGGMAIQIFAGALDIAAAQGILFDNFIKLPIVAFASLPACDAEGKTIGINDSNTTTFGATITAGGGGGHGIAYCDGTNWTYR